MVKNSSKYSLYFLFYKGIIFLFHKARNCYREHVGLVVLSIFFENGSGLKVLRALRIGWTWVPDTACWGHAVSELDALKIPYARFVLRKGTDFLINSVSDGNNSFRLGTTHSLDRFPRGKNGSPHGNCTRISRGMGLRHRSPVDRKGSKPCFLFCSENIPWTSIL